LIQFSDFVQQKQTNICSHQTHFLGSKYTKNVFAARILPQSSLGSLHYSADPYLDLRSHFVARKREQKKPGKKGRKAMAENKTSPKITSWLQS